MEFKQIMPKSFSFMFKLFSSLVNNTTLNVCDTIIITKRNISGDAVIIKFIFNSTRTFYIGRNNKKVDSIETGPIVIAHLLP